MFDFSKYNQLSLILTKTARITHLYKTNQKCRFYINVILWKLLQKKFKNIERGKLSLTVSAQDIFRKLYIIVINGSSLKALTISKQVNISVGQV